MLATKTIREDGRGRHTSVRRELVPLPGTGVKRIIPKGVMNEPVDHVEFTFDVTG